MRQCGNVASHTLNSAALAPFVPTKLPLAAEVGAWQSAIPACRPEKIGSGRNVQN